MLIIDGAAIVFRVGRSLRNACNNLTHITCKLRVLQLVVLFGDKSINGSNESRIP